MLGEISGYIKRNGFKIVFFHLIEIYFGFLFRYLPGIEGFFFRSLLYKLLLKSKGPDLYIYPGVHMIFSRKICIGQRVAINTGTYIDGRGEVRIGNYVMIGPNCLIVSCEHGYARTDVPMYQQPIKYAPIVISDDVWIGGNAVIKSGVTIGEGSVVAAGTVVTSDVPSYCVFGGVPGKVIKYRRTESEIRN